MDDVCWDALRALSGAADDLEIAEGKLSLGEEITADEWNDTIERWRAARERARGALRGRS